MRCERETPGGAMKRVSKAMQRSILLGLIMSISAVAAARGDTYPAKAMPWQDSSLGFDAPGRIVEVPIYHGEAVQQGQLLAREDDDDQRYAMEMAKIQADSTLRIQAAQAQLDADKVDLRRTQEAAEQNAATPFELQEAQVKVVIDELSLQLEELTHQNDQLKYEQAKAAYLDRQILAPFTGIVEDYQVHVGEIADPSKPAVRLIQIDPLKVEVPVPVDVAAGLQDGQTANVIFATGETLEGTIYWIANASDYASGTLLVRLRVDNPQHLPAGQQVRVDFSASGGAGTTNEPTITTQNSN
ncbi:MAG TPA: efflux RND transporter periplasmic adaptor subunit [Phycisphaerae bacterium]|nr:efflux RND transporter periplasmic adaptor subunit [Phycisphaerae bacterium]